MVDATPFGELVRERRERLGLSFRGAGALVGMHGNTWQAHEENYRVVDGRMVRRTRETPATDALMALAVGITPNELQAIGRPDAAHALRKVLSSETTVDVTEFHVRWLRAEYEQAGSNPGVFLDRMLAKVHDSKPGKRKRPT
jgi:hypothetical protein